MNLLTPDARAAAPTLTPDELYLGAFVLLDGGWLSHPFPLNRFKVTTQEQLDTLRSLKVSAFRWSPERSDPRPQAPLHDAEAEAARAAQAAAQAIEAARAEAESRRERLQSERESLRRCEQRFQSVGASARQVFQQLDRDPLQAGEESAALARGLVGDLLSAEEINVRLLTTMAGDKASFHAVNVAVISLMMGRVMGMAEADLVEMAQGALLHDMGKVDLPERVRHRDDAFTPAELAYHQEHVAHGVARARRMGLPPSTQLVIAQHHEHADGSGFPARIGTERMTLASRIVALVNRYDGLCNPAVPSRAMTPHEALSLIFAQGKAGNGPRRYDTTTLGSFIKMMGVYPPGSVVQLTDDRYAIVVAVNTMRPLKPRVLVHEPSVPASEALTLDLEAEPRLGVRRSLKPSQLPPAALEYLAPRPKVAYYFEPVTAGAPLGAQ